MNALRFIGKCLGLGLLWALMALVVVAATPLALIFAAIVGGFLLFLFLCGVFCSK